MTAASWHVFDHRFHPRDCVGGHLALDLVNTAMARDGEAVDWLAHYAGLLQWAGLTGGFDAADLAALGRAAQARPAAARAALSRCKRLREALHDSLRALADGRPAPAAAVQTLQALRVAAVRRMPLQAQAQAVAARPTRQGSGLDLIADEVLRQALPLLEAPPLPRLRACDGPRCGWLFIDLSRPGHRRWCDMATCGADHKQQRFRARAAARAPHGGKAADEETR